MTTSHLSYVHGYHSVENQRLLDQADSLAEILHSDVRFPAAHRVLEVGCGIGAQTMHLLRNNPETYFVAIDQSKHSLAIAEQNSQKIRHAGIEFLQADIFDLPFPKQSFEHIFICFVLEHLPQPSTALAKLKRLLKPGGSLTIIEGDHGSFYCHPHSADAMRVVQCLIDIQAKMGGNALIGRQLYPLLANADFINIHVSPQMIYIDDSQPKLNQSFSQDTFIAMLEGVEEAVLEGGLISHVDWEKGIAALSQATQHGGSFCYTFFKARAYI